jgi:Ulp1 family protease
LNAHIFTSHFNTKLVEEGFEAVSQWTFKKDINRFTKKLIFILINLSLLWSLSVVVNPGIINGEHESIHDAIPCILIFDPLKNYHSSNEISKHIIDWLNMEWKRVK